MTPSLNQGRFIESTLKSILLQGYERLEYIVVDGGSTDDTVRILETYSPWLAYWQSRADQGLSDALAQGFAQATGDILCYLNSDDLLAPDALSLVAGYFAKHPEIDAIYSHRRIMSENGYVAYHWLLPPHSDYLMKRWSLIPQETCFWRRSLFDRVGGVDTSLKFAVDYDLFVRMMSLGRFKRLNRFLGAFRMYSGQKSSRELHSVGSAGNRSGAKEARHFSPSI